MAASAAYRTGRLTSWAVRGAFVAVLAFTAQMAAPSNASAEQASRSPVGNIILAQGYDEKQNHDGYRPYRRIKPVPGNMPYYGNGRESRPHRGYRPRPGWGNDRRWRADRRWHDRRGYRHRNNGAAIGGAAIFGLATGAILGSALSGGGREYIDPPVRSGGYAPWTPEWYRYCSRKYRSFNPETGYFLAYSGKYRFCR